jgi:hypothetical protein
MRICMRREGSEEEGEKVESEKCKQGKMEGGGEERVPPPHWLYFTLSSCECCVLRHQADN